MKRDSRRKVTFVVMALGLVSLVISVGSVTAKSSDRVQECSKSPDYIAAVHLFERSSRAMTQRQYRRANELALAGLERAAAFLKGSKRRLPDLLDDSQSVLSDADMQARYGRLDQAAKGRVSVLRDRLGLYGGGSLCE